MLIGVGQQCQHIFLQRRCLGPQLPQDFQRGQTQIDRFGVGLRLQQLFQHRERPTPASFELFPGFCSRAWPSRQLLPPIGGGLPFEQGLPFQSTQQHLGRLPAPRQEGTHHQGRHRPPSSAHRSAPRKNALPQCADPLNTRDQGYHGSWPGANSLSPGQGTFAPETRPLAPHCQHSTHPAAGEPLRPRRLTVPALSCDVTHSLRLLRVDLPPVWPGVAVAGGLGGDRPVPALCPEPLGQPPRGGAPALRFDAA